MSAMPMYPADDRGARLTLLLAEARAMKERMAEQVRSAAAMLERWREDAERRGGGSSLPT